VSAQELSPAEASATRREKTIEKSRKEPAAHAAWAFFLDIDGTLLGFADTPAEVTVSSELKQTLERLHRAASGAVALISGRSIASVDALFAPLRFPIAGQHGLERRDSEGQARRYAEQSPRLAPIKECLEPLAARHAGLVLEEKGLTLAIHYRRAPHLASYLHRFVPSLIDPADNLGVQAGKMVIEIKPAGRDKGSTIMDFMGEQPFHGRVPIFIGDDLTDEHGFEVVNARGGLSVKVGPGRTVAKWRFTDVHAVRDWLARCAAA
jgi:trehalose 6-phosphate phosphatase